MHTGGDLLVIDVDEKPGKMSGSKALASLEELHGKLPKTLTNLTGGGGRQLFFYLAAGCGPFGDRLPVVAEWLRSHPEAESAGVIDIRNDGLVVLPPSIHPDGPRYRWEDPDVPIATLPLAWCQTPDPFPFDDPERPTRRRRQGPRLKVKDLSRRDPIAHELMAGVDPDALLGKPTLLRLEGLDDGANPSEHMWSIILGAASVRFDMDRLYDLMDQGPLKEYLRKHGRDWFDGNVFEAHQELAEKILAVEELRAEIEEYEWTTTPYMTKTGRTSKAAPRSMKVVLHEALDEAVRQMTTEPLLNKSKMAVALGVSRKTVVKAFGGLTKLGWLEEVPEPDRRFDDPVIYRLLPAESRRPPQVVHLDPSLDAKTQDTAVLPSALSIPSIPKIPSTVRGCNPLGLEASKDSLSESPVTLSAPTRGKADETPVAGAGMPKLAHDTGPTKSQAAAAKAQQSMSMSESPAPMLRNFDDAAEPPRTKKRADPWATHTCRKCGQPTLTMRDPDTDRPFRVDAQPSPIGNWVVVDDRWQVLQGEGRTNHEREHDETERAYYAWHNCPTRDPEPPVSPPQRVPQPLKLPEPPLPAPTPIQRAVAASRLPHNEYHPFRRGCCGLHAGNVVHIPPWER